MMRTQIANIITGCRIICSIFLLFCPVFSLAFYITYLLCGFSDMIDGTVARKTNSNSSFGAKLDTAADFVFMFVVLYKLLPLIQIRGWLWVWIIAIAVIKLNNILWGLLRRKTCISVHSLLNKITGFALFLLPLTIQFVELKYGVTAICLIATISAIQEGHYIRTGQEIV